MTAHHDHHHSDPTLPCGTCHKRHRRIGDVSDVATRPAGRRAIVSIAAIFATLATVTNPIHAAAVGVASPFMGEKYTKRTDLTPGGREYKFDVVAARRVLHEIGEEHTHDSMFDISDALAAAEEEHEGGEVEHDEHSNGGDVEHTSSLAALVSGGEDQGEESEAGHTHTDGHNHGDESSEKGHMSSLELLVNGPGDTEEEEHDHDHSDHHGDHDEEFHSSSASDETESSSLPWGQVIGATLLVNLASLSGCLIVVWMAVYRGYLKMRATSSRQQRRLSVQDSTLVGHGVFFDICIPAFAVGALIATAVFLIFPEALHLIEGAHGFEDGHSDHGEEGDTHEGHRYLQEEDSHAGHDDSSESANAAKFGCAILAGFLLPLVFAIFFHRDEVEKNEVASLPPQLGDEEAFSCASCNNVVEKPDVETGVSVSVTGKTVSFDQEPPTTIIKKIEEDSPQDRCACDVCDEGEHCGVPGQESVPLVTKTDVDRQLCASILLGDAFHNFADGVFIGAAFKSCSTGTALSIILVTLFHEIAQELADFILLTRYAGLSILKACVLNFISGLSVCLGGVIFLAANPSNQATGIILAMAGGVYFNIAACETIPRVQGVIKTRWDEVWTLLAVIVGTVPIGLILLNHQHCG